MSYWIVPEPPGPSVGIGRSGEEFAASGGLMTGCGTVTFPHDQIGELMGVGVAGRRCPAAIT